MCLNDIYLGLGELPSFGKELLTRFTVHSLCIMSICNLILVVSHFGFGGRTLVLIAQFLVIAYLVLYSHTKNFQFSTGVLDYFSYVVLYIYLVHVLNSFRPGSRFQYTVVLTLILAQS